MADIKINELEPTTDLMGLYTIGSDRTGESKKVSLQFLKDASDYAIEQGDYAKQEGETIESRITDLTAETNTKLTELSAEVSGLSEVLDIYEYEGEKTKQLIEGKDFSTTSGYAQGGSTSQPTTNNQFLRTSYIQMSAGDVIVVNASAPSYVAIIAQRDGNTEKLIPLVVGGGWNAMSDYQWLAKESCEVVVSWQIVNNFTLGGISLISKGKIVQSMVLDSLENSIETISAEANEGQDLVDYPIECKVVNNIAFNHKYLPAIRFEKASAWNTKILKIVQGIEKVKVSLSNSSAYGYVIFLADGTYISELGKLSDKEIEIPNNASMLYVSTKTTTPIRISGRRINLTSLIPNVENKLSESSSLYGLVEANSTGRFKFDEVGVVDYHNAFKELAYMSPHLTEMETLGMSQQPSGNAVDQSTYPILRFRYQKVGATPTRMIVLMAAIHGDSQGFTNNGGDSPQNILSLYYFLMDLIFNPEKNDKYKWLTDNYIIDVVPIINPWGVQNHSRFNGRGVDLNRNSPHNWESCTDSAKGTAPFSEAETQIYRDYIESRIAEGMPIDYVMEIHSRGEIVMSADTRFMGFGPDNFEKSPFSVAIQMGNKYDSNAGWKAYTSAEADPMMWAWVNWEKGIPAFNPECCQSMKNDISTRNSRFVNLQMADFVSELAFWCANPSGNIVNL